jgi:hypothetical protein
MVSPTFQQTVPDRPVPSAPTTRPGIAVLFTLTALVGASLPFVVQPLVAKMMLPSFGGAATVWSTSSLFFQVLLLAGYLYTHWSTARLGWRWQPRAHWLLLLLPVVALPLALPAPAAPPSDASPTLWLLRVLVVIGLPFLVLSTTGPLLQRWYAWTDGPRSQDPYFLFAATNLGSFGGAARLPLPRRAPPPRLRAEVGVLGRLRHLRRARGHVRSRGHPFGRALDPGDAPQHGSQRLGRPLDAPCPGLGRTRLPPVVADAGRHRPPLHRRRGDPPALGGAARHLPRHVRRGLRAVEPLHPARRDPAGDGHGVRQRPAGGGRRPPPRAAQHLGAPRHPRRGGLRRPRPTRGEPARAGPPDRLLRRGGGRRRRGWRAQRAGGTPDVQTGCGSTAPPWRPCRCSWWV